MVVVAVCCGLGGGVAVVVIAVVVGLFGCVADFFFFRFLLECVSGWFVGG